MKERPIIFSGEMVRAILEGRKTQTRRVMKPPPPDWIDKFGYTFFTPKGAISGRGYVDGSILAERIGEKFFKLPYGVPGDRLWVRETFDIDWHYDEDGHREPAVYYRADLDPDDDAGGWKPSIYMPSWASRITLEIAGVRVERVQVIGYKDLFAEGICQPRPEGWLEWELRDQFITLWDRINAKRGYSWVSNPWVWVIEFKRV